MQNPFVISLATTYSPTISSTIGADGFNFSVRNGKRWSPAAIVTLRLFCHPLNPPSGTDCPVLRDARRAEGSTSIS